MSSEKECCVPECSGNSDSHTVLHLFPNPAKNMDRFRTWVFNIGGDILKFSNDFIYKNRRVCHAHFEVKYCCRYNRISNISVPTLNLPGPLSISKFTHPHKIPFREVENLPSTSKESSGSATPSTSDKHTQSEENDKNSTDEDNLPKKNRESAICSGPESLPEFTSKTREPLAEIENVPSQESSSRATPSTSGKHTQSEENDKNSTDEDNLSKKNRESAVCSESSGSATPSTSDKHTQSEENDKNSTDEDNLPKKNRESAVCSGPESLPEFTSKTREPLAEIENVPSQGLEKMDSFKLKLKNVLHSTSYCGLCLENDVNISTINENLEIIVNERTHTKTLKAIIDVVFKETHCTLASSLICNSCEEKLIQSYIFIENAKETYKILDNYVNDLFSKSDDIFNNLPESSIGSTNVVIVLENNIHDPPDKRKIKDEFNIIAEENNEILEARKEFTPKRKKFKCVKCLVLLPSLRALKMHRMKCKKQILRCRQCFRTFKNKQHLNVHYKLHFKVKCKFCPEILHKKELLDHLKTKHGDSLLKCLKCELFYPLKTCQTHTNVCQQIKEKKPQCLMCLKTYTEKEFKSHTCKYGCTECTEIPCMHYKYLKSYREQTLNNAYKIKCVDCYYVCARKENLLGHVNKHHLNNHPYTCHKCGQEFYSKVVLKAHILRFHENCFVCQYCDSEFRNINNYESHVISCEDIKRKFTCANCPASFDSYDGLKNHMKCRHSSDIFPCGLCNKKFLKDSKRKEHMVKVHSSIKIKNKDKNVECVVCQEKFGDKGELLQHMKSHGPHTMYPCRICNTEYQTLRQFRAHNRKHNGPFATCHVCGKQMREILLKKHLTTHSDSVETCKTCGRSFQNITLLKYHQKVHLESVPCPKCKKMINPARLRRHWRGHLKEENPARKGIRKQQPNLKCELCEYKTWNNTLLECHMNRHHLKIKPYVCHICSKDFIGKHLLKKHIETHDMKSVVCMVCLKSFANSTCLKMHLRLHTGEKPFTCEICGDRFRSSSIMNVHKLKKHSGKSYTCPLCSNKFYTVRDLRRHVIKVHWKQKNKKFDPRELKGLEKEHYHLFHDGRRVKVADEDVDFYMPC